MKPHLQPEVTSGQRRQHRSTETSTISTYGEAPSSHILESAQVVSTHPSSSIIFDMESLQLPVVTIHPISETIPPKPDVVQMEVNSDLVSFLL